MSNLTDNIGNSKLPSVINDPFKKNQIKRVSVWSEQKLFGKEGEWESRGRVTFKNGNTEGEQSFQAPTFDEVVIQIKAMLENLE